MGDKIHVVIVDDHPLYREGVTRTLQAEHDFEVVGQGATGEDAARLTCDLLPDILLLDLGIPGGGIATCQTIASTCPVTRIVILTASEDEDNLTSALRAGAKAYILKGVSARELVSIIRGVFAGEVYVTPSLATGLLMEMTGTPSGARPPISPFDELTERERQILEWVASGASNREIGQKLYLSEKTVKHYMTNILQKLQVRNRVEAALMAQRRSQLQQKA